MQAPYQGALWTPGWWGWSHSRYGFFRGYWGPHIGYYGGINYGYGYTGIGYQGGYWNSGRFYYNRAVNNINVNIVHNVYDRTVVMNNNVRVSYNGGQGGLQVRPRPAELAALREPHAAPMTTQIQNQRAASLNRAQFVASNNGRPADLVVPKPLPADRDVHPVAPPPMRNLPQAMQPRPGMNPSTRPGTAPSAMPPSRPNEPARSETRPYEPRPTPGVQPAHPIAPQPRAAQPAPMEARPNAPQPARSAPRPIAPPSRTVEPARPAERPAPPRPEVAPAPHPQPRPEHERPVNPPAPSAPRKEPPHQERPAPREAAPARSEPEPKREPAEKPKPPNEHPR